MAPTTELDRRYSSPGTVAVAWTRALDLLGSAPLSWITTVRADGRPHVTPLITVWHDDALNFCTGPDEQKARNLTGNPAVCLVVPGDELQVVVEGAADRVTDADTLETLAGLWRTRHGWDFRAHAAGFAHEDGGIAHVFTVRPAVARGFGTGEPFTQTRWTFPDRPGTRQDVPSHPEEQS